MIEILCIAAEITAVLLILSIAIPTTASKHVRMTKMPAESAIESQLLLDCQESLVALQSLLYLRAPKPAAFATEEQSNSESSEAVIDRLREHLNAITPLQIASTLDPVTKLFDRQQLERLLEASEQWFPFTNTPIWVGLLQVDNLDQLDDEHGPMGSELILRQIASYLYDQVGGFSPLVRYDHSSFSIALHGWSRENAVEFFESVRADIQKQVATIDESTIATTASAAIVSFDATEQLDELWDRLEVGIVEAVSAGANRGRWYDALDSSWHPMGTESGEELVATAEENATVEKTDVDEVVEDQPPAFEKPSPAPTADASSDAVSSEDIASLFKAAHVHAAKKLEAPVVPPATPVPAATAEPTDDDIESLFTTFKKSKPSPNVEVGVPAS